MKDEISNNGINICVSNFMCNINDIDRKNQGKNWGSNVAKYSLGNLSVT